MSDRTLPAAVLRSADPIEITVDGVALLIREPTAAEFGRLVESCLISDGTHARVRGDYSTKLIQLCVVDPAIPDASVLTVAFAANLARAIEQHIGLDAPATKNGCGGNCTCTQSPHDCT